jgi:hypothetical protein
LTNDAATAIDALLTAQGNLTALLSDAVNMPRADALRALARALDQVALAYHDVPDCPPDDREGEAVDEKAPGLRLRVCASFPELGQYWEADLSPDAELDKLLQLADARDDLEEIIEALAGIKWRAEHWGPGAAAYSARLFQPHTLSHLLGLRRFLHQCLFGW